MDEHHPSPTTHHDLINLLLQDGLGEGLPKIAELLMNAAMLMERAKHIGAGPYERVETRNGHANGFNPRSFHTSMGGLNLATPQVRGSDIPFRTSLLEKGSRSDRALKAAISSMYLQGVSTRRVTTVMGELCGFEISSTQVSKLTAELDLEFEKWRARPLPEISHLFTDATYSRSASRVTSGTAPPSAPVPGNAASSTSNRTPKPTFPPKTSNQKSPLTSGGSSTPKTAPMPKPSLSNSSELTGKPRPSLPPSPSVAG